MNLIELNQVFAQLEKEPESETNNDLLSFYYQKKEELGERIKTAINKRLSADFHYNEHRLYL